MPQQPASEIFWHFLVDCLAHHGRCKSSCWLGLGEAILSLMYLLFFTKICSSSKVPSKRLILSSHRIKDVVGK
ncbi:hypothetical protein TcWFU_008062 [Taenia crassiceps]|uniref:Uncharacterized protein n=1 Tax=Taenia crassiceps TaxID=6207 RepID=A0ABR4Q6T9_9CEST